jgi:hypothetical protein
VVSRKSRHFEHISQPVLPRPVYLRRLAGSTAVGLVLIGVALLIGMAGYRGIVGLSWIDAYENAAMILSGMGPMAQPATWAGKFFAGTYALFSGIAILATVGIIFAPVVHRFLHRLYNDVDKP